MLQDDPIGDLYFTKNGSEKSCVLFNKSSMVNTNICYDFFSKKGYQNGGW
jgi:hypothetical protein